MCESDGSLVVGLIRAGHGGDAEDEAGRRCKSGYVFKSYQRAGSLGGPPHSTEQPSSPKAEQPEQQPEQQPESGEAATSQRQLRSSRPCQVGGDEWPPCGGLCEQLELRLRLDKAGSGRWR